MGVSYVFSTSWNLLPEDEIIDTDSGCNVRNKPYKISSTHADDLIISKVRSCKGGYLMLLKSS